MTDLGQLSQEVAATASLLGHPLAVGLLIGLERGWTSRHAQEGSRVAGLRTFGLLGLTGGVAGLLSAALATALLGGAGLIVLTGYVRQSREPDTRSATSAIAAILVLALGALATSGQPVAALAGAAATVLLLSMRDTLHGLVRGLSAEELRAVARFAILALVLLPFMPDRPMGPLGAVNPRQLMLVIILVAGLSFAGYWLARRAKAARSLVLMAGFGAIVSSTVVTVTLARRLAIGSGAPAALAAGIALASAISVARVGVLVMILTPWAIGPVAATLAPALALLAGATWWALCRPSGEEHHQAIALGNPLELKTAVAFAALVAVTSIASRWALAAHGDAGVGVVLALIGLADVDAAVIAFSAMPAAAITPTMAGVVLALPVLLNMLLKAGLVLGVSRSRAHVAAAAPIGAAAFLIGAAIVIALQ